MKLFKSLSFLALLLGCALYSYWLTNKDYQWIVPYLDERQPAAVRDNQDLGDVVEKPMRVFKRDMVASSIVIRTHEGQQSFSMGQFAVKSPQTGNENLVCLEYPYLQLVFSGEGATLGGRKTEVVVTAPCKMDANSKDYLANVPLPFGDLERRPAEDQEFQLSDPDATSNVKVQNVISGNWPSKWQLERVEFHKDASYQLNDKIILTSEELRQQLGEPFFVK